jgi:hypothetical protein
MSDENQINETQVKSEISQIELDPLYLNFDPLVKPQRDALVQRRADLYNKLYPPEQRNPGEPELADPVSHELSQAMREGLQLREEKLRGESEARKAAMEQRRVRGEEIAGMIDGDQYGTACSAIRHDLIQFGIDDRDLTIVDYMSEIIRDTDNVHPEIRSIMFDFLALIYDYKHKTRRE